MGRIRRQHKINVTIPAGIDDGQTISIRGQGNTGSKGGPNGDLLVTVSVRPHKLFTREGANIMYELNIPVTQAILGAEVTVPTIDGDVKYNIPEGTQSGTVFRLRNKGIPYIRGTGRGDQYVTVNVNIPKNLTGDQKEIVRQLDDALNGREHSAKKKKWRL
jgi:molecular chaperone DnaJ